jgi:membrane-associated phospholipid phosphatase
VRYDAVGTLTGLMIDKPGNPQRLQRRTGNDHETGMMTLGNTGNGAPVWRPAVWFVRNPAAMALTVVAIYVIVSVFVFDGLHIDRPLTMAFCAVLAFALSARQPSRRALSLILDWIPLFLVLVAYDFARGAGYRLGIHTSYYLSPKMDRWLTGTIPTIWLQRHIYANGVHHRWDILPTFTYFSYYLVTFIILAVLWARSRQRFRLYSRRLVAVTVLGLVAFVLHPTAPPWLDAQRHVIRHLHRTTTLGLAEAHLPIAQHAFYASAATLNQVAAFPSLHAAYSVLPLMMFWRRSGIWLRAVMVLYPLAMGFSLVLTGEHWLSDILAAWILVAAVALGMPVVERNIARLRGAGRGRDVHPPVQAPTSGELLGA